MSGKAVEDHELKCPDCDSSMALMKDRHGIRYRCRDLDCRGAHGAHPDGKPFGIPADAETRRARIEAHDAFDRIWKSKKMDRGRAYIWLRQEMQVDEVGSHIGQFDVTMCKKLVATVRNCWPELFPFDD